MERKKGYRIPRDTNYTHYFKDISYLEMIKIVDKEFPISLKNNEDLINRIHAKYPALTKAQVSLIVKAFFQSLRDLLIASKTIYLYGFLNNMKFFFYKVFNPYKKGQAVLLRTKIFTPKFMKPVAENKDKDEEYI